MATRGMTVPRPEAAKLTEDQARDVIARLARKEKQASIARLYGVHVRVVTRINDGLSWNNLPRPD